MRDRLKILTLIFSLIMKGCDSLNSPDCFQKAGEQIITRITEFPEFDKLVIYDDINLQIIEDDTTYFELDYYENLIPEIQYELDNDSIVFTNNNSCNFVRSFKAPTLIFHSDKPENFIVSLSTGDIFNKDTLRNNIRVITEDVSNIVRLTVNNNQTVFSSNSSTNFYATGKTSLLILRAYFNDSKYYCKDLQAERVDLVHRGYNDMIVYASDSIVGAIENAGRVFYDGNPGLNIEITYGGQLIPLNK